jgi:hypothetical protein
MEQTVDDNQPFEDVTSLERAYPGASDVLERTRGENRATSPKPDRGHK